MSVNRRADGQFPVRINRAGGGRGPNDRAKTAIVQEMIRGLHITRYQTSWSG